MSEWRELSDGGYSEVYKAKLLGVTVAVKAATGRKKTSGESLLREIRYLQLCGAHPNIVQPYGAFVEGGRIHLILEFARHCLRTDRVARSCDPIVVMAGVSRALVRIHSLGIVHRDIKSRNVMVAVDNRALLIDFGLACDVERDGEEWLSRTVGTKKYRPPEMRDGRRAHGSMDVYCFGLLLEKLVRAVDTLAPQNRLDRLGGYRPVVLKVSAHGGLVEQQLAQALVHRLEGHERVAEGDGDVARNGGVGQVSLQARDGQLE